MSFISADAIFFINVVIFLLLVSVGTFYVAILSREYFNIKKQKANLSKKQDQLLVGLEEQVQQIVENTSQELKKILVMAVSQKHQLKSVFEAESEKLLASHQDQLDKLIKHQIDVSHKTFSELEKQLNNRGNQWLKTRESVLDKTLAKFEAKLADDYQKRLESIENDLERYKKEQFDMVKQQTKGLFEALIKDLLKKHLSTAELEKILDESLEKFIKAYAKY